VGGNCALLEPFTVDNKILSFAGDNISLQASTIIEGKLAVWRPCKIQLLRLKGNSLHALICMNDSISVNRRNAYRVDVNEYCYVNTGKATVDAMIVDISSTGFAFTVGKYDGDNIEFLQLNYHDSLLDVDVQLNGRVVRRVERDNGSFLFGCVMTPKDAVDKYINQRQRKMIRVV
jgi:hypothetical protein